MSATETPSEPSTPVCIWGLRIAVGVLTVAAFARGLSGEFLNWDDDANLVYNQGFRGFDVEHLRWMFTTFFGGHYQPLSWLSFAVDHAVWGMSPFGYHLTNLLLHCLAAILFLNIAITLLRRCLVGSDTAHENLLRWSGFVAALLFAIHPLRVESVSWVTERRDVLSGVFVMLTVLGYLRAVRVDGNRMGWLAFSWLVFCCALMTKASAVPLPLVLLVLDAYPLQRMRDSVGGWSKLIIEKMPFLLASGIASVLAIKAQASAEAWQSVTRFDYLSRLATALYGLCWYVFKFLVPTNLCALYPIPERSVLLGWTFIATAVLVLGIVVVLIVCRRRLIGLLVALVCYGLLLGPVSGIAQSGEQLVADRYGYLSLLPLSILVAATLVWLVRHRADGKRRESRFIFGCAGVYLAGLFMLTVMQAGTWLSSESLWRQAISVEPASPIAHVNLAEVLREHGETQAAATHYGRAAELNPTDAKAHNGLGITALALNDPKGALEHLERAVELAPDHPKYHYNLAEVWAGYGRWVDAREHYQAAIDAAPCFVQAISRLGQVLSELGLFSEALDTLEGGVACSKGDAGLSGQLAWLLATCPVDSVRDGERAVQLADRVCEVTMLRDPYALSTLAVALAETGAMERALSTQTEAIRVATESKLDPQELSEFHRRRMLFADGQKYQPPAAETNQP